ncbi:hypothetical protein BCR44DRAFT_1443515 [Catenaria anguillulae PL171]|uniref:Uncharacterized protein n=1 Tax=Catenaria anguillulae PL171 TaxID=765915 RepID=A0A1Y2H8L3_9FUNG|nr:hypothetical protein BCR44DRAFT_1443515 [Catenaria anguillulae PL171]
MYIPNRNINIPGKAVIMCSYVLIGLLVKVLKGVTGRILIAVLAYLITVIVGFANGFVNGSYVQFTIENTSAVIAGTFATQSKKFDEKKAGRGSAVPSNTSTMVRKQQSTANTTSNAKTVGTRELSDG